MKPPRIPPYFLKNRYRFLSPRFQSVHWEYKVDTKPRMLPGTRLFEALRTILEQQRPHYREGLQRVLANADSLARIPDAQNQPVSGLEPHWNNGYFPGLDIAVLYTLLGHCRPQHYLEVGSGTSTKVAAQARRDFGLTMEMRSIDPAPRQEIDALVDRVDRVPLEDLRDSEGLIANLGPSDVLFLDNSHRVFSNSDALIGLLEWLPFLSKGVLVHVHDVYLPFDYPQEMCDRFYNEQYMLAALLISNPDRYKVLMPNWFISQDAKLSELVSPLWTTPGMPVVERHGGSFWIEIG